MVGSGRIIGLVLIGLAVVMLAGAGIWIFGASNQSAQPVHQRDEPHAEPCERKNDGSLGVGTAGGHRIARLDGAELLSREPQRRITATTFLLHNT